MPQGVRPSGPGAPGQDAFGGTRGPAPQRPADEPGAEKTGRRGRRPQLPPRGGPRAELPGSAPQQPRTPSWSDRSAEPRASLDTPRGHEEPEVQQTSRMPRIDDRQGPGATAEIPVVGHGNDAQGPGATSEFARPDLGAPRPNAGQDGDQFVRSDVFGTPGGPDSGSATGRFATPQSYDNNSTGQFPQYDGSGTGRHALPARQEPSAGGGFDAAQPGGYGYPQPQAPQQRPAHPEPQAPQRPARREPEALPPATGPGDGRTPLYDTLETNWFRGAQEGEQQGGGAAPQQAPQQPQAPTGQQQRPGASGWRTSPNDELVRQAERVRQPASGGVTTSGLPRRVPRANLVPGTAQQQQHQAGPQVSRAPQDVRGRLTNLRRGIAQGRQAGSGQTGSFPSPTHQQER